MDALGVEPDLDMLPKPFGDRLDLSLFAQGRQDRDTKPFCVCPGWRFAYVVGMSPLLVHGEGKHRERLILWVANNV